MLGLTTQPAADRYFLRENAKGEWVILDQQRDGGIVLRCADAEGAEAIAALMNGDLAALARVSPEAVASCQAIIGVVLRVLRPRGRPAIGEEAFPQV